jgi:methylamine dehydrogenase heavy chain
MKLAKIVVCVSLLMPFLSSARSEFTPEPIGRVETLPAQYPPHWLLVHDFSFFHMSEGEIQVIDPLAPNLGTQYKGMMPASFIAAYQYGAKRNEHYVIESFFARGGRGGERTDVVTVWDPSTLKVTGEVVIPAKRITGMPKMLMSGLMGDEKFLGVYNFTPAQSVTIVNLEDRTFVGEIPTPGCGFLLPHGERSFSSLCANGSLHTSHLNPDGTLASTSKTGVVFNSEQDPIFENPALSGGVAFFPTFHGRMLPIELDGMRPTVRPAWWLTDDDERNWRPGGLNPVAVDSAGLGYLLMHAEGGEGTHKDGGAQVWIYDLAQRQRLGRIVLKNWGISVGTTGTGDNRLLIVTNAELALDVYRIPDGEFVQTLNTGAQTPFMVYGSQR